MTSKFSALQLVGSVLRWTAAVVGLIPAGAAALATGVALAQSPHSPRSQPAPAQVHRSISDQDKNFLAKAADCGVMQAELGKLAAVKAQSPRVRQLASHTAEGFSRAGGMLATIADNIGMQLPQEPTPETRKLALALAADPAGDVDDEYLALVVPASTVAVNLFESEAEGGQNLQIRQFASEMLPQLQQQRNMAVRLAENPGLRGQVRDTAFPPQPANRPP